VRSSSGVTYNIYIHIHVCVCVCVCTCAHTYWGGDTRLEVLVRSNFSGHVAFIEPEGRVEVKDQRHYQKYKKKNLKSQPHSIIATHIQVGPMESTLEFFLAQIFFLPDTIAAVCVECLIGKQKETNSLQGHRAVSRTPIVHHCNTFRQTL
jgi:hypothetical protein